ncbi:uncharacterized protein LOC124469328 isoform X3 [Hypomesus transpacificus]|uniref:uncharacterized protein LOC124469328 isoform X3 n=1 Tax=Hypomesus transpacificus TaxID=137520 RepID=UPI001F0771AF|nr:uncharacterized protein LOC124469328 isoform X3 [Hypomesus transpacificus]
MRPLVFSPTWPFHGLKLFCSVYTYVPVHMTIQLDLEPENVHPVSHPLFTYCSVGATIKYKEVNTLMCDVHKTVMDSQEIWNILREESESFNERMECRKLMELQGRSQSHRSRVALMFKASESNLDRTTLLMANNPLPDLHSHQEGDSPTKYLANDILAQPKRLASIGGPLKGLPPLMKPSKVPSQKQKKLSIPHRALSEVPTSVCVQISENWSMVSDKDIKEEGITSDTDINEFWNPI